MSASPSAAAKRRINSLHAQMAASLAASSSAASGSTSSPAGASAAAGTAAPATAGAAARRTVSGAITTGPPHVAPITLSTEVLTPEQQMYSSRQIALLNVDEATILDTKMQIDQVRVHGIPHLSDTFKDLPSYPNVFVRTKLLDKKQAPSQYPVDPTVAAVQPGASGTAAAAAALHAVAVAPPAAKPAVAQPPSPPPKDAAAAAAAAAGAGAGTARPRAGSGGRQGDRPPSPKMDMKQFQYNQLITDDEVVLLDIVRKPAVTSKAKSFVRAGPRPNIVFHRSEVRAAIVTCGGLCPGLNDVIEELVKTLYYNYGVDTIYGVRSGYRGFHDPEYFPWMTLTPREVAGIHNNGGTILGASRGGFDLDKILKACTTNGVTQLYVIGGDGTHRGANVIAQEALRRKIKLTVACVPKTIDNDIGVIDKSFGFDTAVGEAVKAIHSALVEAKCTPNGIGVVQLMGRHAGYIAAHATLASGQVDLCLIPEVKFPLHGPNSIMKHLMSVTLAQGYSVIVVAEGAGAEHLKPTGRVDESGNPVLPEVGHYLREEISAYFKKHGKAAGIKYHDPSYMIRSVPATAADSVMCTILAQNAVHAAMSGYTAFTVAIVNNRTVLVPISLITASSPSYLNPRGRTWERVVSITHQPNWVLHEPDKHKPPTPSSGGSQK